MSTNAPLSHKINMPAGKTHGGGTTLFLQRKCACGAVVASGSGECESCKRKKHDGVQTKLRVNLPGDPWEREADRTADTVMSMRTARHAPLPVTPVPRIQRSATGTEAATASSEEIGRALSSPSRSLDATARRYLEPRFGHDFSHVRVHTGHDADLSARALNANAYAVGHSLVFADRQYAPATEHGRRLIAHELTHVLQQGRQINVAPSFVQRDDNKQPPKKIKDDWAGKTIPDDEKKGLAIGLFQDLAVTPVKAFGSVKGAKFLLHDTSGASGRAHLESEAKKARGPLGSGPNAFIPASGLEILQRPDFYDARRPTTTEFEKGEDLLKEAGRDVQLRKVWAATAPAAQDMALADALAGLNLSKDEIKDEKSGAKKMLTGSGKIFTTAHWSVASICRRAKKEGAGKVAVDKASAADLGAACKIIGPVLDARQERVASTVSVELVQVGTKQGAKSENSCDPNNPDLIPLPNPPYSNDQYWNTTLLYVRAALAAGVWPKTITHFVEDAFDKGHCDPRCFDLQRLYDSIAGVVGHAKGSTYGIKPSYGMKAGTHTVWWHDTLCHGKAP